MPRDFLSDTTSTTTLTTTPIDYSNFNINSEIDKILVNTYFVPKQYTEDFWGDNDFTKFLKKLSTHKKQLPINSVVYVEFPKTILVLFVDNYYNFKPINIIDLSTVVTDNNLPNKLHDNLPDILNKLLEEQNPTLLQVLTSGVEDISERLDIELETINLSFNTIKQTLDNCALKEDIEKLKSTIDAQEIRYKQSIEQLEKEINEKADQKETTDSLNDLQDQIDNLKRTIETNETLYKHSIEQLEKEINIKLSKEDIQDLINEAKESIENTLVKRLETAEQIYKQSIEKIESEMDKKFDKDNTDEYLTNYVTKADLNTANQTIQTQLNNINTLISQIRTELETIKNK